jgi:hypothetical protein
MLATRKTVGHARRRTLSVRPHRRLYVGSAVTCRASSRVFLARTTQQVTSRTRVSDWLGAAVTLAGVAGWAALLMLLGA